VPFGVRGVHPGFRVVFHLDVDAHREVHRRGPDHVVRVETVQRSVSCALRTLALGARATVRELSRFLEFVHAHTDAISGAGSGRRRRSLRGRRGQKKMLPRATAILLLLCPTAAGLLPAAAFPLLAPSGVLTPFCGVNDRRLHDHACDHAAPSSSAGRRDHAQHEQDVHA